MSRPGLDGVTAAMAVFIAFGPAAPAPAQTGGESDWRDIPPAAGIWVYREDERGSVALYGEPDRAALFLVRCDQAARRIYFSMEGSIDGGTGTMAFQATHGDTSYVARNSPESYIVAATRATDDYLDKIAFSRGRIAVTVAGQPVIAIPNWPQMTRVFEDCRG